MEEQNLPVPLPSMVSRMTRSSCQSAMRQRLSGATKAILRQPRLG